MSLEEILVVSASLDGARLDKVLLEIMPDSSLRLRRRLCDEERVLVDDRPRRPGYKVRPGQRLDIKGASVKMSLNDLGLYMVKQAGMFAAVFKPGGVHSASIAGKDAPSVEALLPDMFPEATPVLLNRLDYLTSGLLLVGLSQDGVKVYHDLEEAGKIKKFYYATIQGRLDGLVSIKRALDTDDRKKTRVLDEDDGDARRWTDVKVLSHDHDRDTTEVRCLIMKGARHQIRAHLASIGHPIVGDPLYGDGKEGDVLRLHHQRVEFSGFSAEVKPL
ncbi:pseudouridine synthase [Pseudodesulfovibrio sp.]|nr:pseudouridine synthase [Pseudodesulfovibrio sp.]